MSTPTQTHDREPSITALVSGIVNDGQELLKQQLALFKSEIRQEITKAREAALSFSAGIAISALGGFLLCFMVAHLIAWAFELPTWAGFGITGGALLFVGVIACAMGRNKLESMHRPEQTMQGIKENVQWLKDPEMIRAQMEQTRASLTEKLEALEHQVVGTVQEATSAVADTVETIREAAQETVGTVKDTVQETVDTVRQTFDVKLQVQRRPWFMLGGSMLLGYVAGTLLDRSMKQPRRTEEWPASRSPARAPALASVAPEPAAAPSRDGLVHKLGEALEPELTKLKGLAIGALIGAIRDVTTTALGEEFGDQVRETFDNVTERLGGQAFKHRILPATDEESCRPSYAPPGRAQGMRY